MAELNISSAATNIGEVTIRKLKPEDIPEAMQFVLIEGWNQTAKDWMLFIANPLNVCKAAEINGRLVGTISSMNYNNKKAWVSMVLVHRDHRGKGISKLLLQAAFEELSSCSVYLDATDAGLAGYRKFDFRDEYRILELVNSDFKGLPDIKEDIELQLIEKSDLPSVIAFDDTAFGADRSELVKYLYKVFPEKSWCIKRDGQIAGYILGRRGNKYHRIGPLSASSSDVAKSLIINALKYLPDQPVVIDILDNKDELIGWLKSLGFVEKRSFTRMYRHINPFPGRTDLLYIIAGPEYG